MKLTFCGAARCVTGSCHMITAKQGKILVDCGMRQGADAKGSLGEGNFPFNPKDINAVLVTHAHIDHTGLLPLLVKRGFSGPILCTTATEELSTIMLPDSAGIQESDVEYQSKKNLRAGKPAVEPLYTQEDADKALRLFHGVPYGKKVEILPGIIAEFTDVGHLLGSAAITLTVTEDDKTTTIVFSGDIGRAGRPILNDPQTIPEADYLLLEGTYGDRDHNEPQNGGARAELTAALKRAIALKGNLIIPAFAIGRIQELLYHIKCLLKEGTVPGLESLPVYIDSPLAIEATKVYEHSANGYYDEETAALAKNGSPFDFPGLRISKTADESKALNTDPVPKIIISASGMCDAGRIRHHLKHNLYKQNACVLLTGYQAVGTLGRSLTDGAKSVKLLGETVSVKANIINTEGFSGHAGKSELLAWAEAIPVKPRHIFLVHGEEESLLSLQTALQADGYKVSIPALFDEAELDGIDPAEPAENVLPMENTAASYECLEQLDRIRNVVIRSEARRSPDMELMRSILEADLKSLADKWDRIIL